MDWLPKNRRGVQRKGIFSSTDILGLFLPGGNVIYQISKVPICRDLRDVEKSGGLILIHIRFLRLQELSGSKRIDSKAS